MSLPNLFLLAAPRSGSTQLARWLDTHPEISLSGVKEPNHFSSHDFPPDYVARTHLDDVPPTGPPPRRTQFAVFRDRDAYERLFAPLGCTWRLDASTSYLACPEAPGRIARAAPGARVILLTRDPVARAISHYRLARRTGRTRATLGEELALEEAGAMPPGARYLLRPSRIEAAQARVHAAFAPEAILSLRFEDMVADPAQAVARIADFLGIAPTFDLEVSARNAGAEPRFALLNSLALTSGLKTALRRRLPNRVKPLAKRLWLRDRPAPIPEADLMRLRRALARS
jgi:LPS sulfotransferase NodH